MSARPAGGNAWPRRSAVAAAALLAVGCLTALAMNAGAAPRPTVAEVQQKINDLTTQFNKVSAQLDQADAQLNSAQQQLRQVTARWRRANAEFKAAQTAVAQIAASAYEDTGSTSIAGVLTSGDPQAILQQGSLLLELSTARNAQTQQLLAAASQLAGVQQEMQRTESGVALLKKELTERKASLKRLIATQQATLASLTYQQQQQVRTATIGKGGTGNITPPPTASLPTGTQADTAVAFAFSQLGCPYVYGGDGPCPQGYDCSGLAQASWRAAGVDIPRDTYSQWAALPHISMSELQPGDLLYYNGESHVAIYVGNGNIIDAPVPGQRVEEIPMNTPWYAQSLDGAVRP